MPNMAKNLQYNETTPVHSMTIKRKLRNCTVNVGVEVEPNDFVYASKNGRIGRVLELVDNQHASIRWYLFKSDLPENFTYTIKLSQNELIEQASRKPDTINLNLICGKCQVIFALENESADHVLKSYDSKSSSSMYVCRYKLVKTTIYQLLPVRWRINKDGIQIPDSEDDVNIAYSDVDQQSVASNYETLNLRDEIEKLHLSTTERNEAEDNKKDGKRVTPFKIVENTVIKCNQSEKNGENEIVNDNDVSPSKRIKLVDELNQNYLVESPAQQNRINSNDKSIRMTNVRKNLNRSFAETSMDEIFGDAILTPTVDTNGPKYTSEILDAGNNLKMMLRKRLPLKEQHDNSAKVESILTKYENKHISHLATEQLTPRRRSILKTDSGSTRNTPRKSVIINVDERKETKVHVLGTPNRRTSKRESSRTAATKISICAEDSSPDAKPTKSTRAGRSINKSITEPTTPKSVTRKSSVFKTPSSSTMTPQQTRKLYRSGNLTPSIQGRELPMRTDQTELEMVRERLHVSAVPTSLPCREKEFSNIYSFVIGKLTDKCGGCIYISGVPGTGKTATVTQVIKHIQSESKSRKLPAFDYIDINGMRLTEPRQAYVQIYRQLTGKTMAWAQARDLLEDRFTGNRKSIRTTVLLVDELDIICNRKQDVVYNLFDWTTRKNSCLVAITIANTMDLPERVLKLKVASRLGLTRITFQPYSFKQLQEVVMARLAGSSCFISDAVQLVARKVASVSGDCRRALDICRRATEIAEESGSESKDQVVNFTHVNQALSEMFASPKVRAIKNCTNAEKMFLQAVASEITRTGIEEVDFYGAFMQITTLAPVLGIQNPMSEDQAMKVCMTLTANRLLIAEDSSMGLYQKIILNASVDDLYYALNN